MAQIDALFDKANKGEIRIIIGGTEKLGTGVNVQERLKAVHHIDIPWRPADFEQRNGRIERQGNTYKEVDVHYYITSQSLDSFKFQVLKFKQHFINQIRNSSSSRVANDYDSGDDISYAELVAEITGNKLVKELAMLTKQIERDEAEISYLKRQAYSAKSTIERLEGDLHTIKLRKQKISFALDIYKQYESKIDEEKFFTLSDGTKCNPIEFGNLVLSNKETDKEIEIAYVGDTKNFRVILVPNQRLDTATASMRLCVYDDDKNIILDTSYNYGAIADKAETIGENPIKALKGLYKGLETFVEKETPLIQKLKEAQLLIDPKNKENILLLEKKLEENINHISEIKTKVAKERVMEESKNSQRIKFQDLIADGISFTQKHLQSQSVQDSSLSLNF